MGGDERFGVVVTVAVVVHDGADDPAEVGGEVKGAAVFEVGVKQFVEPAHVGGDVVLEFLFTDRSLGGDELTSPVVLEVQDFAGDLPAVRQLEQELPASGVLHQERKETLTDAEHGVELVLGMDPSLLDDVVDDAQ